MKIIVTGGTGFIGRHIVLRLCADGHEVTFTGRNRESAASVISASQNKAIFACVDHGSDSGQTLKEISLGANAMIHCAGFSSPWGKTSDYQKCNVQSMHEVITACKAGNVQRLIYISSPSIYCEAHDRYEIKEEDPLPAPINEYARTKRVGELLLLAKKPCEVVIFRPRAVFGPWDRILLPRLLRVAQRQAIPIARNGDAQLDLTYIDNLVDAVVAALDKSAFSEIATYNVSNGQPLSFRTLLKLIARTFEVPIATRVVPVFALRGLAHGMELWSRFVSHTEPLLTRYSVIAVSYSQTLSIDRIRTDLNYHPEVTIEEGLRRHAESWRTDGLKVFGGNND